jgi:hypothetical protein
LEASVIPRARSEEKAYRGARLSGQEYRDIAAGPVAPSRPKIDLTAALIEASSRRT